ncbi:hypothetical protein BC830DRAFT_1231424 [Chytriomyces sp. MP71]|nr:hypothetical protein BC830DRAFT_1231424 [Chytriomyces sp. MP71]
MSNLVDVVPLAIFTASSVDTTSSACANDACDASKVADSQAKSASDDATYWQTAVDPSCSTQAWYLSLAWKDGDLAYHSSAMQDPRRLDLRRALLSVLHHN